MTTGAGKLLCTACGRTYESKTSYTAHYTNNQCLKMIIPGMIQDYHDDPQDDLEGEEDQDQVPEGEGKQQNSLTSSNIFLTFCSLILYRILAICNIFRTLFQFLEV